MLQHREWAIKVNHPMFVIVALEHCLATSFILREPFGFSTERPSALDTILPSKVPSGIDSYIQS